MIFKVIITFLFSLQTVFCLGQWVEVKSTDGVEDIEGAGMVRFSGSTGYVLESQSIKPRLFVSHNAGLTWKLKRYFNETTVSNNLKDFIIKQNGNLLFCDADNVLEMDSTFLLLDTVFHIEPNRTKSPDVVLRQPDLYSFGSDSIFMLSNNLFVSYDDGKTWQRKGDLYTEFHKALHFVDNKIGYFLGWTGDFYNLKLFSTNDGGNTWDTVGEPLQQMANMQIKFITKDTGFLGGNDNCLYKTTDRGKTWQKWYCLNDGKPVNSINAISFIDNTTGWITIDDRNQSFKTVDGGKSFFSQALPFPAPTTVRGIEIISPSLQFLLGSKLYRSTNQGGSPMLSIKPVSGEKAERNVTLYPNPAKNSITFNVEDENSYNIRVFDIMGKEYANYVDISSNTSINIEGLSSGIYFLQYTNGSYSKSIKFIKE